MDIQDENQQPQENPTPENQDAPAPAAQEEPTPAPVDEPKIEEEEPAATAGSYEDIEEEFVEVTDERDLRGLEKRGPGGPGGGRGPGGRGPGGSGGGGGRGRGPGGPGGGGDRRGGPGGGGRGQRQQQEKEDNPWKEKVIQIRRVTKVVKGGKKLSFRAVVVVGNGQGQVGLGIGKSSEVIGAIQKGVAAAKKSIIDVPIFKTTIPHEIKATAGSATVVMRPASEGTGVIAGGAARAVLELAGIGNILSKSLGSNSPLNVARATIVGLSRLRTFRQIAELRGMSVKEMIM